MKEKDLIRIEEKKKERIKSLSSTVEMIEKDKEILARNLEVILLMQGKNEPLSEVVELLTSIEFYVDENDLIIQIKDVEKIMGQKRTKVYKLIDKLMSTLDDLEESLLPIQVRREFSKISITEELRIDLNLFLVDYKNYLNT